MSTLVTAAVVIPILTLVSVAGARWVGRWFTKAMHDTFADAVNEIVAPPIDRHIADHAVLAGRLAALELAAVELERRVISAEAAIVAFREDR